MKPPGVKIWLSVGLIALGGSLYLIHRSLPGPDEARALAIETFENYARDESIEPSLFQGPTLGDVSAVPYSFEWSYRDEDGKLSVLVLIDRGGWRKIFFDVNDSFDGSQGAIDHLNCLVRHAKQRTQSEAVKIAARGNLGLEFRKRVAKPTPAGLPS